MRAEGNGIRVEVPADESLEERGGRLVIPGSGVRIDEEHVRSLRDAAQK